MNAKQHSLSESIGVVIIGRNEGSRLLRCLASVECEGRTVVYVDSGSSDGSVDAARAAGVIVVELDLSVPFTAARARNAGFEAILSARRSLKFVQFVDGDCEVDRYWIEKAMKFLSRHSDVAVVCGRRRERFPEASIFNRMFDREWDTPTGVAEACGGDSLMRCDAFKAVGGFDPTLICGEEPELCIRLREEGWRIWRLDAEMTLHDAAMTSWSQWWKRNVRSGYGFAEVHMMHRESELDIWMKSTLRAVVWGGVVPTIIILSALIHPAALLGFGVYPAQVARIALRATDTNTDDWVHAGLITLGKFPEFQGVMTYVYRRFRGAKSTLIEYKAAE